MTTAQEIAAALGEKGDASFLAMRELISWNEGGFCRKKPTGGSLLVIAIGQNEEYRRELLEQCEEVLEPLMDRQFP